MRTIDAGRRHLARWLHALGRRVSPPSSGATSRLPYLVTMEPSVAVAGFAQLGERVEAAKRAETEARRNLAEALELYLKATG